MSVPSSSVRPVLPQGDDPRESPRASDGRTAARKSKDLSRGARGLRVGGWASLSCYC